MKVLWINLWKSDSWYYCCS